jgi:hypothetical protein
MTPAIQVLKERTIQLRRKQSLGVNIGEQNHAILTDQIQN